MLARVAERLYWMGRQLERAENTARLVNATTQVLLDSPPGIELGWDQVLRVMGLHGEDAASEAQAVQLLLLDENNPGSVVMSLRHARENARALREVLPREVWEELNDLYLRASRGMLEVLDRSRRYNALGEVVEGRLLLAGRLSETMSRDVAFQFLRLGELLERADMTSRIVDLSSAVASTAPGGLGMETTWISILRATSALQMYRRHEDVRIASARVVHFLFNDPRFPRALRFCLDGMEDILAELPRPADALRATRMAARLLPGAAQRSASESGLPALIDEVQQRLAVIHQAIDESYFHAPGNGGCEEPSHLQRQINEQMQ